MKSILCDLDGTLYAQTQILNFFLRGTKDRPFLKYGNNLPIKDHAKNLIAKYKQDNNYKYFAKNCLECFGEYINGYTDEDITSEVLEFCIDNPEESIFSPWVKDLTKYSISNNYQFIVVTNSTKHFANVFYELLKIRFDIELPKNHVCTTFKKNGNINTSVCVEQINGQTKASHPDKYFDIDWKNSIAIGDTDGDMFMTEKAGLGILISSNKTNNLDLVNTKLVTREDIFKFISSK